MNLPKLKKEHQKKEVIEYKNIVYPKPVVSICIQTYQHKNFIRQCLEGVLMQKTNFSFEILLGEDDSSDGTREICLEYAEKYSDRIRLFLHHRQNNIKINGKPTGRFNFLYNLYNAKGRYIALCEGDDYWTDPLKLQKQVAFLEKNSLFSCSAHQSVIIYEDSTNRTSKKFAENVASELSIKDFLGHRKFHTASMVFRAELIKKHFLPINIVSADRALILLLGSYGKIKYFEDEMCCYRKNTGGISSWVSAKMLAKDLNILKWIKNINPAFPQRKYAHFIYRTVLFYPPLISPTEVLKYSIHFIASSFVYFPGNLRTIAHFLRYQFPGLVKKSLKQ